MSLKSIEPFVCGGIASCTAELFTFPIDLVKTRLQLQGQQPLVANPTSNLNAIRYRGMLHCLTTVAKDEGLKGLYNG
jgi:hypothetical protein